jgi:1-acyl-sn-glycerol-3-phosphate acyltransferase
LILFPKGTSTDGSHVKRFKSTLFASLDHIDGDAWVQPVSIVYTHDKTGKALSQTARQRFTWFGNMTLAPHLLQVFATNGCEVEVMFHKPLCSADYAGRKRLAKASEHVISKHVAETIARTENTIPPEKGVDDLHVGSAPMVRTP